MYVHINYYLKTVVFKTDILWKQAGSNFVDNNISFPQNK